MGGTIMKTCSSCGKEFEGEQDVCPECSKQDVEVKSENLDEGNMNVNSTEETVVPPKEVAKEKPNNKKKKKIIGIVAAIVLVAVIAIGVKVSMDKKAHEAYVKAYNEYVLNVKTTCTTILVGASDVEDYTNDTKAVWNNAIWKKSDAKTDPFTKVDGVFVSDFNTALGSYFSDATTLEKKKEIMDKRTELDVKLKGMKEVPEGLEDHFKKLSEFYDSYYEYSTLAISPSGSYTSYRDALTKATDSLLDKYDIVNELNYDLIK